MNRNSRKTQKLLKQYPFVNTIINQRLAPLGHVGSVGFDDIDIRVQVADSNLVLCQLEGFGINDNLYLPNGRGLRGGFLITRGIDYIFAVGPNQEVLRSINGQEKRRRKTDCVREIFRPGRWENPIYDQVEYLVLVLIRTEHVHSQNEKRPFGEFTKRMVSVIIYRKPEIGFKAIDKQADFLKHLYLNRMILFPKSDKEWDRLRRGPFNKKNSIAMVEHLGRLTCEFNAALGVGWGDANTSGGASPKFVAFGDIEVMVGRYQGFDSLILEDKNSKLELVGSISNKTLEIHDLIGFLPGIQHLIMTAIDAFNNEAFCERVGLVPKTNNV